MATTPKEKAPEPLRKITSSTVMGKEYIDGMLELLMKEKTKAIPLYDVWGICTRAKPGESDNGPFVKFLGQFRAVNLQTGEIFRAPTVMFPRFLEEELHGALSMPGASQAEFGFRISAKYDKDSATKYVYLADSLVEPANNDALTALEAKMQEARRALPAPKKAA